MIFGIDEAGRGCVIGPLVLCRAGIEPKKQKELIKLGVRDSKKLTPGQRERLEGPIRQLCEIKTYHLSAAEITKKMQKMNLNDIEAEAISKLLGEMPQSAQVFIDSPDNVPIKFAERIRRFIANPPYLVCENKAEDRYPIVAAASIIAKLERDREIERIKKELGYDFNSGYTSDPITTAFLARHAQDNKLKPYVRWKWATLENLRQKKMSEY